MFYLLLAQITDNLDNFKGAVFTVSNLFNMLSNFSCWFLRFALIALGIMIVVYGVMFILSRGNPTEMSGAKKALGWGIVGGLVIMGVFTIVLTIPQLLGTFSGQQVDFSPIVKIMTSCT